MGEIIVEQRGDTARQARRRWTTSRRRTIRSRTVLGESLENREFLAGDLTAQWRADDLLATLAAGAPVTQWTDAIGQRAATATGSPTFLRGVVGGRSAVRFDPTNGNDAFTISRTVNPMNQANDFSVVTVFATNATTLAGGVTQWYENSGLVDSSDLGFSQDWGLAMNASGQLAAGTGSGFGQLAHTVYSPTNWNDGTVHSAVFTRQASLLSLYVDGTLVGSRNDGSTVARNSSRDMFLGNVAAGTRPFAGDIAEVRIYNGTLDAAQVTSLANELRTYYNNSPPDSQGDNYQVNEDGSLDVTVANGVLVNDHDVNGDSMTVVQVVAPTHGTLTLQANGAFQYVPQANYFGADQFTYQATDGAGAVGAVTTVTIQVQSVNDPPVTVSDVFFAPPSGPLAIDATRGVLSNDRDIDGTPLSVSLVSAPTRGQLVLRNDGSFTYTPGPSYANTDTFSYQVTDGQATSGPVVVSVVRDSLQEQQRVVINELHVNPDLNTELVEFVELHNTGTIPVDLSGWYFGDGIDYVFPENARIEPNGFVVIAQSPAALLKKFNAASFGPFAGNLNSEGENVELRTREGIVVDNLTYELGYPWPTTGEAPGNSMQLIQPTIDNSVGAAWRSALPTPGGANTIVLTSNPAPMTRQVQHSPEQPHSGQDVTISLRVTDTDGIGNVTLEYQDVAPGAYIRLTDPAYQTQWTAVTMNDKGLAGDLVPGDSIFTAVLPGSLQVHRHLVRYRISATDNLGVKVTVPYADDPQPNFAYFVYDGVPDWTGSKRPGTAPNVTYTSETLTSVATYHLIAVETDVNNSQYNSSFNLRQFNATMVYDGIVYDHIKFRNRGAASTYQVGKNKWKLNFTRGHSFQARDNYGNRYPVDWDKINVLPGTNPWWRNDVSTEGTVLFEPVAFRLYELAGAPASHTQYFEFRIIDGADEVGTTQYIGDRWGLYIAIQQPDGRFLEERGMDDGNIFNMHGSAPASSIRNQADLLPSDKSDLRTFLTDSGKAMTEEWWRQNLNFDDYFAWNAINLAVNNSDLRPAENVNYYHNQVTGQWSTLPWDLDLTFEDRPHLSRPDSQWENLQRVFTRYPSIKTLYQNRVRELLDLMLDNGDAARVVEEYAGFLTKGDPVNTIVEANQAMWDYHPRKAKKGIWYKNFTPSLMPNPSFDGLVGYMKTFLSPGGYGRQALAAKEVDAEIPATPTIRYLGAVNYPLNGLTFATDAFADPQGNDSFGGMEWQVSAVNQPGVVGYNPQQPPRYEIEGIGWKSGELPQFGSQVQVPGARLEPGQAYRARVRMKDNTGRWSHWSNAIEFVASAGVSEVDKYLRVSEIHYHPADPSAAEITAGHANADDFEFIELINTSNRVLDLTGSRLVTTTVAGASEGVEFDFSTSAVTQLQPGQRIVVVEDLSAFRARYGEQVVVAGEWAGQLSNGGETLALAVFDDVYQRFAYDDAWHPTTDGAGRSLELINPSATDLTSWNNAAAWRPSARDGGSPGSSGLADVPGDANHDGVFNSTDLVLVFQAGQYEDDIEDNSLWEQGDWNGDHDFDTSDLVEAFQAGSYVAGAISRNDEPTAVGVAATALNESIEEDWSQLAQDLTSYRTKRKIRDRVDAVWAEFQLF